MLYDWCRLLVCCNSSGSCDRRCTGRTPVVEVHLAQLTQFIVANVWAWPSMSICWRDEARPTSGRWSLSNLLSLYGRIFSNWDDCGYLIDVHEDVGDRAGLVWWAMNSSKCLHATKAALLRTLFHRCLRPSPLLRIVMFYGISWLHCWNNYWHSGSRRPCILHLSVVLKSCHLTLRNALSLEAHLFGGPLKVVGHLVRIRLSQTVLQSVFLARW